MAKYIKQEMTDLNGVGKPQAYYRMEHTGRVMMTEFVRRIATSGSGVSEGTVLHVLSQSVDVLAQLMAEGHTVTVDGLGTFSAALGVCPGKEMDQLDAGGPKRNAQSIEVNQVRFRPDKRLVQEVDRRCALERGGVCRLCRSPYTRTERLERARDFLKEHALMRVSDYMSLVGLSHTAAVRELQSFRSDASTGIAASGRGAGLVYVLRKDV